MSPHWFRPASRPTSRRGRAASPARSCTPLLEPLENRLALAVVAVVTNPVDEYDAYSPGLSNPPVGNDGLLSLREAIRYLDDNGGGSISFDPTVFATPRVITLTLGQLPDLSQSMTLTGPAAALTIDAQHHSGIFFINSGQSVSLSGLTLTGGFAFQGGAINNFGTVALSNCTLAGNSAQLGGGFYNAGTASLLNCTLRFNFAQAKGGGIDNWGSLGLTNCTVSSNFAPDGAGININSGTQLTAANSTLDHNDASDGGGGLFNFEGTAALTNCTLDQNEAFSGGGTGGAGIVNKSLGPAASLTLLNCTITGNSVAFPSLGGGLFNSGGSAKLTNTIVAGNVSNGANDIQGTNVDPASSYNLIGTGGSGGLLDMVNHNQVGVANPGLAPLGNYGGPTQTMALLPGSPALDKGTDVTFLYDQRGAPFLRKVNGAVDVGAFEFQSDCTITVNSTADTNSRDGSMTLREAILLTDGTLHLNDLTTQERMQVVGDPGLPGRTDVIQFALGGSATITLSGTELPAISHNVSVQGPTATRVTVNGNGQSRDFEVGSADPAVEIDNLTISGGSAYVGGGVLIDFGNTLTLNNCTLCGNSAYFGGGLYNDGGTATLTGCTVHDNFAVYNGGGLYLNGGSAALGTSQICNNTAYDGSGGGLYLASTGSCDPLSLTGCTVSGNSAYFDGGGLYLGSGNSTALCNSTVSNNLAYVGRGGGIFLQDEGLFRLTLDPLSLAGSTVSGNCAGADGGGLYLGSNNSTALCNSRLCNNTAGGDGGGLFLAASGSVSPTLTTDPLSLTNCLVSGNTAYGEGGGGGLFLGGGGSTALCNSTVRNNLASCGDGGGINLAESFLFLDPLALTDCTVRGNSASGNGGGLYFSFGDSVALLNSTLSGNSAGSEGGGLYVAGASLSLTNCTLANNTAAYNGGGLASGTVSATNALILTNVTISGNSIGGDTGAAGGGLYEDFGSATLVNTLVAGNTNNGNRSDVFGGVDPASSFNNLIGDNTGLAGGIHTGDGHGNLVGTSTSPINALLAPLLNYGGPTDTMALLPGSPAIDAGTNAGAPSTDQRGVSRPQVLAFDIGAFESQGFTMTIVSGDNQLVEPNTTLPLPFVVLVTPVDGTDPVQGGQVTFTAPGSGPSGTFPGPSLTALATIGMDGTATAPLLTTNGIQGAFTVSASASGANTVLFHVTNAIAAVINGNLVVVGTNGNDNITVTYANGAFNVNVNGRSLTFAVAPAGQVSNTGHVIIYGLDSTPPAGTDNITMSGKFPAEIHAGNGRTIVHGGAGGDVIYGGALRTSVLTAYAGTGADVIVGGPGTAKMYAGSGGKAVLIGGSLKAGMGFDTYASLATLATQWAGGNAAQIAAQLTALTAAFQAGVSDTLTATGGAGTWGVASAAATFSGFALPPTGHDKKTVL